MKPVPFFLLLGLILSLPILTTAQTSSLPHLKKKGDVTQLIVHGKPFIMLGGELHNSSMGDADYMRR